ncbi:MAG: cyclic nucleotide-binding domain-containing protein [Desulfobacterales bacterium]|nr:cyclic nucleotide-binding domain-containing protein [Desulfobacteraceae bacterium]MDH3827409.1 cyclic nucleotide-binding domain-containing protein [Desulfobacterales bacterium]
MQLLSSCYLFKGLSESQLQRLNTITKETPIQKGQWLMHEDERAEALFVLKEGAVELLTTVNDDFELPIAILRNPGDCTGTSSLVAPHEYSLSARCAENGTLFAIQQADLKHLMLEDHELGCTIMKNLAQHLLDRLKETRQELKIHFKTLFKSSHH